MSMRIEAALVSCLVLGACGGSPQGRAGGEIPPARQAAKSHYTACVAAYEKGELPTAIAEASLAIEKDPTFAAAYGYRSFAKEDLGDLEGAVADGSRAIELDPAWAPFYHHRGLLKFKQRDYEAAIRDFSRAMERDPAAADYVVSRACARAMEGELEEAIADFGKGIEIDPKHYLAYLNRGSCRVQLASGGDLDLALKDLDRAAELNPRAGEPLAYRGAVFLLRQDLGGALKEVAAALKKDPRCVTAFRIRAGVRLREANPLAAMQDYERALKFAPRDWADRDTVTQELNRLTTGVPPVQALLLSGWAAYSQKSYQKAVVEYSKAIELSPENAMAHLLRANVLRDMGKHEEALEDYARALKLDPAGESAYCERGYLRLDRGEFDRAEEDFAKALELNGDHVRSHCGRARIRYSRGDLDGGLLDLTKLLETGGLEPGDRALALKWCAWGHHQKGDHATAIPEYSQALELEPGDPWLLWGRGMSRLLQGDAKGARDDGDTLVRLDPENLEGLLIRGAARQAARDPEGARLDYEQLRQRAPRDWRWRLYVETSLKEWKAQEGPAPGAQEEISAWIRKLSSPELWERRRASRELGRRGPEAVTPLRQALGAASGELAKSMAAILERLEAPPREVAARINGEPITWRQVRDSTGTDKPEDLTPALLAGQRRIVSEETLLWQLADRKDLGVTEAELQETLEGDERSYGGHEEFERAIRLRQGTLARYRDQRLQDRTFWKLYTLILNSLVPDPAFADLVLDQGVSAEDVRKYYLSNPTQFETSERVTFTRVGMTFTNAQQEAQKREIAEAVLRKLQKGSEFVMLAYFYSDIRRAKDFSDRSVSRKDLEGTYSPETIRYLFDDLNEGEVSPIIRESRSINIFKMEQKVKLKTVAWEEAQARIRSQLEGQKWAESRKKMMDRLKQGARIEPPDVFAEGK